MRAARHQFHRKRDGVMTLFSTPSSHLPQDGHGVVQVRPGVSYGYEVQYFGAPWIEPETIVLLHGSGESAAAWEQWVGPLATHYRVVRPDLPGYGRSPVPAPDYSFSPATLAADIGALLTQLGIEQFHLAGAKYGGSIALELAADQPKRVKTLCTFSAPVSGSMGGKADLNTLPDMVRKNGPRGFAAKTMADRLGRDTSRAQIRWWNDDLSSKVSSDILIRTMMGAGTMSLDSKFGLIDAPTLVVTTTGNSMQSTSSINAYQKKIPHSELLVMKSDSYHIAAVEPLQCAKIVMDFIAKHADGKVAPL
jgi:3-oxoadipate enol-lactonase